MKYEFKDNLSKAEFDGFTYDHEIGTFFQSSKWAAVKSEWDPIYTGVYESNKLVGVALVLKRKIVLNYSLMYAPRGPVLDYDNEELVKFYLNSLSKLAKQHKVISMTIDPYVIRSHYSMFDKMNSDLKIEYDDHMVKIIDDSGFKHTGFVLDLRDSFQPRFTPFLDLSKPEHYNKSRAYKNAEKAIRDTVKIRRGTVDDIDEFSKVINKTEDYKSISLRSGEYFKRLKNAFGDDCLITFAYIDLNEEMQSLTDRLTDIHKRLDNPTLKEGRRREYEGQVKKIEKDIEFIGEQLKQHELVNIGALLGLKNQNKSELLYAGMDRDYQKYYGSNVNYYDAINWSVESGCDMVSFGGCSGSFDHGIDKYKVTYLPTVNEYIGEFMLINKPIVHYLFELALKLKRK